MKKKSKNKEFFYESIASDWKKVMNSYEVEKRIDLVFEKILKGNLKNASFLDAGCGIGLFSSEAEKRGAQVTSLDVGKALLKQVSKRCNSKTVVGLVTCLPFEDDFFDVVLSTEVLEHSSDPKLGFKELVRVTRPGGRIIITIPNRIWYLSVPVAKILRIRPYQGFENWLWWNQIKRLAGEHDLDIEKMFGFNMIPLFYSPFHKFNDYMDKFGHRIGPLMVNIALSAKKKNSGCNYKK